MLLVTPGQDTISHPRFVVTVWPAPTKMVGTVTVVVSSIQLTRGGRPRMLRFRSPEPVLWMVTVTEIGAFEVSGGRVTLNRPLLRSRLENSVVVHSRLMGTTVTLFVSLATTMLPLLGGQMLTAVQL